MGIYRTPIITSSHHALHAWLSAVCSVQSPFAPASMLALIKSMFRDAFRDASPESIIELVEACESAAETAHRARWSLLEDSGPPRNKIVVNKEQQRLEWHTSVECSAYWYAYCGRTCWGVYLVGEHNVRRQALLDDVLTWPKALIIGESYTVTKLPVAYERIVGGLYPITKLPTACDHDRVRNDCSLQADCAAYDDNVSNRTAMVNRTLCQDCGCVVCSGCGAHQWYP